MRAHRTVLSLSLISLALAMACRTVTGLVLSREEPDGQSAVQQPSSTPLALPTESSDDQPQTVDFRGRLISYDHDGISVYDPETLDRSELIASPLWLPQEDLKHISNTGLIAVRTTSEENVPTDLSLTIMSVPEHRLIKQIPLFSKQLQDDLRQGRFSLTWLEMDPALALLDRWFMHQWSPDGSNVAFAAAIDGPSADVYLYDLTEDVLTRVTEERGQAVVLGRSPDGEWVVFTEASEFYYDSYEVADHERVGYFADTVRAVSTRTGRVVDLYRMSQGNRFRVAGWYSDTEFAVTEVATQVGMLLLSYVDISSRSTEMEWASGMQGIAIDSESRVAAWTMDPVATYKGIHLKSPETDSLRLDHLNTGDYAGPIVWYPELRRFVTEAVDGIAAIPPHGENIRIYDGYYCPPAASPDGMMVAFWGCGQWPGLELFYESGEWIQDYDVEYVAIATWVDGPNSLFVLEDHGGQFALVRIDLATQEVEVIDRDSRKFITTVVRKVEGLSLPGQAYSDERAAQGPTRTPGPAPYPTLTASSTPYPPPPDANYPHPPEFRLQLDDYGPWITISSSDNIEAANADGSARQELFPYFPRPRPGRPFEQQLWETSVSETGWAALRANPFYDYGLDPSLAIAALPFREAIFEIPLLSYELSDRLNVPEAELGTLSAHDQDLFLALTGGDHFETLSWSPDNSKLVFVGALDGPSTDLYLWETEFFDVFRLTDGPNQPRILGWSPDGRWVLHQAVKNLDPDNPHAGEVVGLWSAAADGSGSRRLPGLDLPAEVVGWLSPSRPILAYHDREATYYREMQILDLDTAKTTVVTRVPFLMKATDELQNWFIFQSFKGEENSGAKILQLVNGIPAVSDLDAQLVNLGYAAARDWAWSPELGAMLVQDDDRVVLVMSQDLDPFMTLDSGCDLPVISPDGQYLAFHYCDRPYPGLLVHQFGRGFVDFVEGSRAYQIRWLPDSSGFYYFDGFGDGADPLMFFDIESEHSTEVMPGVGSGSTELQVVEGGDWRWE